MAILKKWWPTLCPVVLMILTMVAPSLQAWISHAVAPLLALHPAVAAASATVIVALYHALPSPLQK
jgi:hypothetical protein